VATVTIDELSKRYAGGGEPAVKAVSLAVADGEFMVLLGPSGCGKSSVLRMIAGLEPITSGTVAIDGRPVNHVPAKDRDIAMVFQSYALYPHMTVHANLAFGLRRRSVPGDEIDRRVRGVAEKLGLTPFLARKPHALSGGQRQRVALGRAIVRDPKVFLFDEPLSNLDAALRVSTRNELIKQQHELGTTTIYVTHDQVEAMTMGDRICIMNKGEVVQIGKPLEVYRNPADAFVARFLGNPPMNLLPARLEQAGDRTIARFSDVAVELTAYPISALKPYVGGSVTLGVRLTIVGSVLSRTVTIAVSVSVLPELLVAVQVISVAPSGNIEPDAGTVRIGDVDLTRIRGKALRQQRRRIQMVFQDPFASLNPRRKVGNIITDGPIAHGVDPAAARKRAGELLSLVGLNASAMERFPHEFSGGQRQRIGIARALALDPEILVADEAVSALDVSVQAQVLDLLEDLKARLGLSMLFITHDLRVAAQICDRIAVMQHGAIVELKSASLLFAAPEHAYTRELLSAVPGQTSSSKAA